MKFIAIKRSSDTDRGHPHARQLYACIWRHTAERPRDHHSLWRHSVGPISRTASRPTSLHIAAASVLWIVEMWSARCPQFH